MEIIPVLDILNGLVVHAQAGRRETYTPIKSALVEGAEPVRVASALVEAFKPRRLYIADLDAIMRNTSPTPAIPLIRGVTGVDLMVDGGVDSLAKGRRLLGAGASRVVIGTETLANPRLIAEALSAFGVGRVTVSLDLYGGQVLAPPGSLRSLTPTQFCKVAAALGVEEVILLDLSRVGSGRGLDLGLIKRVLEVGGFKLYVGGGVRGMGDLIELRELGVEGVLVATALHKVLITPQSLVDEGMMG